MSTPSPTSGPTLLQILESDFLTAFGPQLLTLLGAIQTNAGNPIRDAAAWGQFLGNLAPALIAFDTTVAGQIITNLQGKIAAAVSAAQTAAKPA